MKNLPANEKVEEKEKKDSYRNSSEDGKVNLASPFKATEKANATVHTSLVSKFGTIKS